MPLRLILQNDHAFGPDEIAILNSAFEGALTKLGLVDRTDAATESRTESSSLQSEASAIPIDCANGR
jgi:hypothetical protein